MLWQSYITLSNSQRPDFEKYRLSMLIGQNDEVT